MMRMLSITIARDGAGNVITASRVPQGQIRPHLQCYCPCCGCPLVLLEKSISTGPRFEHDSDVFPVEKLRRCVYYDPHHRENKRLEQLREVLRTQAPLVLVTDWHCRLCQSNYTGEKHCSQCHTGIYSIGASAAKTDTNQVSGDSVCLTSHQMRSEAH